MNCSCIFSFKITNWIRLEHPSVVGSIVYYSRHLCMLIYMILTNRNAVGFYSSGQTVLGSVSSNTISSPSLAQYCVTGNMIYINRNVLWRSIQCWESAAAITFAHFLFYERIQLDLAGQGNNRLQRKYPDN